MKYSDKFVLYHTTDVNTIFKAREKKGTRTDLYNIKVVINQMSFLLKEVLKEDVVVRGSHTHILWECLLKEQGSRAEKLLYDHIQWKKIDIPSKMNEYT